MPTLSDVLQTDNPIVLTNKEHPTPKTETFREHHAIDYRLLANWIREKRQHAGKSALAVASDCQLSDRFIQRIESGQQAVPFHEFILICRSLGIVPSEGLQWVEEMTARHDRVKQMFQTKIG